MLSIFTLVLAFGYLYLAFRCRAGFLRVHAIDARTANEAALPDVTVIVAARNEAGSITACLDAFTRLNYPENQIQFIVVDDGSTDGTVDVVQAHRLHGRSLKLLRAEPGQRGKNEAIWLALQQTQTEVVLTTDADCIVPITWARSMVGALDAQTAFVAGPVLYTFEETLNHRMQALEFLGLVAVGAGSIGANLPTICNSANLCYRRSVFLKASAMYPDLARLPGFDEVLLQSIHRNSEWRVAFCPGERAAVLTAPAPDAVTFLRQRIRWASLAGRVPDWRVKLISTFIFVFFLSICALAISVLLSDSPLQFLLLAIGIKMIGDLGILSVATRAYNRRTLLRTFVPAELLHIPYILTTSVLGLFGSARSQPSDDRRW